ncbi:MAG TPA: helix-turn-helix domain-containing protein [Acidimicrobiales bacterium]|jgi:excisionase family DNA binding protein|nr:helix-turn-helix domain-containing protein [Acidimicrobiales bacterium]
MDDQGRREEVLTVDEAAALLRIGRGAAYALTQRFRATGGREGLPVIELGRTLRVPRHALEALLAVEVTGTTSPPEAA